MQHGAVNITRGGHQYPVTANTLSSTHEITQSTILDAKTINMPNTPAMFKDVSVSVSRRTFCDRLSGTPWKPPWRLMELYGGSIEVSMELHGSSVEISVEVSMEALWSP